MASLFPAVTVVAVCLSSPFVALAQGIPGQPGPVRPNPFKDAADAPSSSKGRNEWKIEFSGPVTSKLYKCPDCTPAAADIKKWFEGKEGVTNVSLSDENRKITFQWAGPLKHLRGLEAFFATDHIKIDIVSPLRLDFHFNPRRGGSFKTGDMEKGLSKLGALKVTSFGAGDYEVWHWMDGLGFFDGLREECDFLQVDATLRSHEVLVFEGNLRSAAPAVPRLLRDMKGLILVEAEETRLRLLVTKGAVKEAQVLEALKPLKIELKRVKAPSP